MRILLSAFALSILSCGSEVAEVKKSPAFRKTFSLGKRLVGLSLPSDLMVEMNSGVFTTREVLARMGRDYSHANAILLGKELRRHGFAGVFADVGGKKRMLYFAPHNPQLQEVLVGGKVLQTGMEGRKAFLAKLREIRTGRGGLASVTTAQQLVLLRKIDNLPADFIMRIMRNSVFTAREVLAKMGVEYSQLQASYLGKALKKSGFSRVATSDFGVYGEGHVVYFYRQNPQLEDFLSDGEAPREDNERKRVFFTRIREMYASRFGGLLTTTVQHFVLLNELENLPANFMAMMRNDIFTGREVLAEMGKEYAQEEARALGKVLKKLDFASVRLYVGKEKHTFYFSPHNPQLQDVLAAGKIPQKGEEGRRALLKRIKEVLEARGWF